MINFKPFPLLKSDRFLLRAIKIEDVHEIMELRSNPETMKYIPRPLLTSHEQALQHIQNIKDTIDKKEGINWVITTKENNVLMGLIGHYRIKPEHSRCELGYMLLPKFHNKGIITEVMDVVLNFAFYEMEMHSIEAIIDPRNGASEKVLLKNNFKKEAHLVENEKFNGQFIDTVIYSLLKRNYDAHKN